MWIIRWCIIHISPVHRESNFIRVFSLFSVRFLISLPAKCHLKVCKVLKAHCGFNIDLIIIKGIISERILGAPSYHQNWLSRLKMVLSHLIGCHKSKESLLRPSRLLCSSLHSKHTHIVALSKRHTGPPILSCGSVTIIEATRGELGRFQNLHFLQHFNNKNTGPSSCNRYLYCVSPMT